MSQQAPLTTGFVKVRIRSSHLGGSEWEDPLYWVAIYFAQTAHWGHRVSQHPWADGGGSFVDGFAWFTVIFKPVRYRCDPTLRIERSLISHPSQGIAVITANVALYSKPL